MDKKMRDSHAAYWETIQREKCKGVGLPPVVYAFKPPFLFDCRLNCSRRMGIGDQMCLLSAIQGVADRVGNDNVLIQYDPKYPGSEDVFSMSGIPVFGVGGNALYPPGYNVIPCRAHIMTHPAGRPSPCLYGESVGNPVSQIQWGWGWHGLFIGHPVRLALYPDHSSVSRAASMAGKLSPYVTCTPLEVSRANESCDIVAWMRLLMTVDIDTRIVFGCANHEIGTMSTMIDEMQLPNKTSILCETLETWKTIVDLADANYTGNSAGMWLALASRTKTYLLQHDSPEHRHNMMWNLKPSWKVPNVEVVNV